MRATIRRSLIVLCSVSCLAGQSVPSSPAPPPVSRSYEGLLRSLAVISRKSDDLDAAGNKTQKLKQGVCDSLAVASADCGLIFQTAVAMDALLQALDQQAKTVIDNVRKQHPHKPQADGTVLPPPPPELNQLQAQREAIVRSAASTLQQQLSAAGEAALANYLTARPR
jgi:hypothetical protein